MDKTKAIMDSIMDTANEIMDTAKNVTANPNPNPWANPAISRLKDAMRLLADSKRALHGIGTTASHEANDSIEMCLDRVLEAIDSAREAAGHLTFHAATKEIRF